MVSMVLAEARTASLPTTLGCAKPMEFEPLIMRYDGYLPHHQH